MLFISGSLIFKRANKFIEHQGEITRDLTRQNKVSKVKKKFYKMRNDLLKKSLIVLKVIILWDFVLMMKKLKKS